MSGINEFIIIRQFNFWLLLNKYWDKNEYKINKS